MNFKKNNNHFGRFDIYFILFCGKVLSTQKFE